MKWGRGWETAIRKAEYEHARTREIAAKLLKAECGTKHKLGERRDLCPVCIEIRGRIARIER